MLELSDKDFKTAIVTMLDELKQNILVIDEVEKSPTEIENLKKANWNFRTEKYNDSDFLKNQYIGLRIEMTRKESVNLKTLTEITQSKQDKERKD